MVNIIIATCGSPRSIDGLSGLLMSCLLILAVGSINSTAETFEWTHRPEVSRGLQRSPETLSLSASAMHDKADS